MVREGMSWGWADLLRKEKGVSIGAQPRAVRVSRCTGKERVAAMADRVFASTSLPFFFIKRADGVAPPLLGYE